MAPRLPTPVPAPSANCVLCPPLAAYRVENQAENPDWHNALVPGFGSLTSQLLVVGIAPCMRGANRTGRVFTSDHAGNLLYKTLLRYGFAKGVYLAAVNDRLMPLDCRIVNAVRCLPPANQPPPPETITCNRFLRAEWQAMAAVLKSLRHAGFAFSMASSMNAPTGCGWPIATLSPATA